MIVVVVVVVVVVACIQIAWVELMKMADVLIRRLIQVEEFLFFFVNFSICL